MAAAISSRLLAGLCAFGATAAWGSEALAAPGTEHAEELTWAVQLAEHYPTIRTNITYVIANNYAAKLDVYVPRGDDKPKPTLLYIHGGGWMDVNSKETSPFAFLPFLQRGWTVVNVDYRPSSVSPAPAAVEDCLCALRWVGRNAKDYSIDVHQIVIMGGSAGGHLALMTGMVPLAPSGLGKPCVFADAYGSGSAVVPTPVRVAAIVNWSGITDVADIAAGPHQQAFGVIWLGNPTDRMALAKLVSPLSYVRAGLPPIITIHGENDPLVPHSQAVRLHDALTKVGVPNKLVTIASGGHALFGAEATRDAYVQIFSFLEKNGLR